MVEAPLGAEVAVERGQVRVEAVVVVLELHLDAGERGVVHHALDALRVHHREAVGGVVELLLQLAVALHELLAALFVERTQRVEAVEQRAGHEVAGTASRTTVLVGVLVGGGVVGPAPTVPAHSELVEGVVREHHLEVLAHVEALGPAVEELLAAAVGRAHRADRHVALVGVDVVLVRLRPRRRVLVGVVDEVSDRVGTSVMAIVEPPEPASAMRERSKEI